jgi:hypothetical protein
MAAPNPLHCQMAVCSSCNLPFTCGMRETSEPCWCAALPALPSIEPAQDCLCPACLKARLAADAAAHREPVADAR